MRLILCCALLAQGCSLVANIRSQSHTGHLACNDGSVSPTCTPYGWYQQPNWYQSTRPEGCCESNGGPLYRNGGWVYQ